MVKKKKKNTSGCQAFAAMIIQVLSVKQCCELGRTLGATKLGATVMDRACDQRNRATGLFVTDRKATAMSLTATFARKLNFTL